MFYSQLILAKKGALGNLWLAAHWHTKLTKAQVLKTDIKKSVESIQYHDVPMALRMSGHLLLGVTRIYAKQVEYLLTECNDAMVKIKMAFRPGEAKIDLQPEQSVANTAAITLRLDIPETFGEFDIPLPDITEAILPELDESNLISIPLATGKEVSINMTNVDDRTDDATQQALFPLQETFQDDPLLQEEDDIILPDRERTLAGTPIAEPMDFGGGEMVTFEPGTPGFTVTPGHEGEPVVTTPGMPTPGISPGPGFIEQPSPAPAKEKKGPRHGVHVDPASMIDSKTIKRQLEDTSNIVREMIPAPPTKRAMLQRERETMAPSHWLVTPTIEGLPASLLEVFSRHATNGPLTYLQKQLSPPLALTPGAPSIRPLEEEEESPPELPVSPPPVQFFGEEEPGLGMGFPPVSPPPAFELPQEGITPGGGITTEEAATTGTSFSVRTRRMQQYLERQFKEDVPELSYLSMVEGKKKKTVAGTFFEILVLKTNGMLDVTQDEPYGDIRIRKTGNFNLNLSSS